jgi:NAD(P)-dependent dehydrogenase (short-subunit alcohol dehydrogenase family)
VNVASMAGLVHPPMMSAYNATKAAVVALSETLRLELAGDGILVTVVCPGFFRTNLADSLRASDPAIEGITRALVVRSRRSAPQIAELVRRGVERGDAHVLTHADGRAAWMLKRFLPFPLYLKFLARGSRRMLSRRPEPRPGGPAS